MVDRLTTALWRLWERKGRPERRWSGEIDNRLPIACNKDTETSRATPLITLTEVYLLDDKTTLS